MQVRRAEFADAAALTAIRRAAILGLSVSALTPSEAEKWANQFTPARIILALQEHAVWVAVEKVVTGSRRGIGSLLLEVAESFVLTSGYDVARLSASTNAVHFYLHRGYRRCGLPDADGALPLRKPLSL